MSLTPYLVTALQEDFADSQSSGKNVVVGAVVTLFTTAGVAVTMYDDASSSNPSTGKTTDALGQRLIWVEPNVYDLVINGGAAIRINIATAQKEYTTTELINSTDIFSSDTVINTTGFTTSGDGGKGGWKKTGVTGETPSQSPAQLLNGLFNGGNGDQWALVNLGESTLNALGLLKDSLAAAANNALIMQAAYNAADSKTSTQLLTCKAGVYYYQPAPSVYVRKGHKLKGAGQGAAVSISVYEASLSSDITTFVLVGTGTKLVRTRREYRGSSGEAQDTAISVGFDLEAIGATIEGVRFDLYCDYTDASPTNLGDNWDVQVKVTRVDQQLLQCSFSGYPRYKHVLIDATRGVGLPEFDATFPTDTNAKGVDGCIIHGIRTTGSSGIGLMGPKPKTGLLHPGYQYNTGCRISASANVTNGDTVTIDGVVFTFITTRLYPNQVQVGASASASLVNLRAEWIKNKQLPYEDLTLHVDGDYLYIYSKSSSATNVSETSATLSIIEQGSATVVTGTVAIADPAQYYDETLGALVDDGRCSLGASDFSLDDYVISVAHHSGRRMTDINAAKDQTTESDLVMGCLHIDGIGGSIFIHKWNIGAGRFESVEPFTVRLGLTGRGFIGLGSTFDSNVTAWTSTSGGALTSADQYGKIAGSFENTCRVAIITHDDPGSYYPWDINGNRQFTNFRQYVNRVYVEDFAYIGGALRVGHTSTDTDTGSVNIISGRNANSELIFGTEANNNIARVRASATGGLSIAVSPSGTGAFEDVMFVSSSSHIIYNTITLDGIGDNYRAKSPDGTLYKLEPDNGGGTATWEVT
jgi:hypothetical protein